jgi:hypothetical protein
VFEDARLLVLRFDGEPPAEPLVTIRERLHADGTRTTVHREDAARLALNQRPVDSGARMPSHPMRG